MQVFSSAATHSDDDVLNAAPLVTAMGDGYIIKVFFFYGSLDEGGAGTSDRDEWNYTYNNIIIHNRCNIIILNNDGSCSTITIANRFNNNIIIARPLFTKYIPNNVVPTHNRRIK